MLIGVTAMFIVVAVTAGYVYWRYSQLFPEPSTEIVTLTPEKRETLQRLRAERKFRPDDMYTGVEPPAEEERPISAVNGVIDEVLSKPDGPIKAELVSDLIGSSMRKVTLLATEDRDRTGDYMREIWYIFGFKGATGRFAYGSSYGFPEGYGEPQPRGWKSPDKPRLIE